MGKLKILKMPAPGQEDLEFKVSLDYIASCRIPWAS
jgi:hypothetical protein